MADTTLSRMLGQAAEERLRADNSRLEAENAALRKAMAKVLRACPKCREGYLLTKWAGALELLADG